MSAQLSMQLRLQVLPTSKQQAATQTVHAEHWLPGGCYAVRRWSSEVANNLCCGSVHQGHFAIPGEDQHLKQQQIQKE